MPAIIAVIMVMKEVIVAMNVELMLFLGAQPLAQFQKKWNSRDVVGDGEETEEIVLK